METSDVTELPDTPGVSDFAWSPSYRATFASSRRWLFNGPVANSPAHENAELAGSSRWR